MGVIRLRGRRWITVFSLGLLAGLLPLVAASPAAAATPVFINEIHYDNTGTDTSEAIEVAGPAGTDLTGWTIVLYNGNGGALYDTDALPAGPIPDLGGGFGVVHIIYPTNGIQNGSPDGIALVDNASTVVQFLSYEGSFAAVGGPADGMTSTDIGISQTGSGPVGESLQLTGTGTTYEDFTWALATSTFGGFNSGQTFGDGGGGEEPAAVINEFVLNHAGADTHEFVEVFGPPDTDLSNFTILEVEGDSSGTATGTIDEVIGVGTTDGAGSWVSGFTANALENGTLTLLLVDGFTGAAGDDLDTDDDGILDSTPWTAIVDGVAVTDSGTSDLTYAQPVLTPGFDGGAVTVGGASRIPDGNDDDTAANWVRNDFDGEGVPGFTGTPVVGEAINTPGATNQVFVPPPFSCETPATLTLISAIQGSGSTSPLEGQSVVVEAAVTAVTAGLSGFYVQEEPADDDGDATTSEGVFVFSVPPADLAVGDVVRISAAVTEFETSGGASSLTELSNATVAECAVDPVTITPTVVEFPVASVDELERYEGMLITLPQELVISEYFNFDRFNEIVVALPMPGLDRLFTPTAVVEPGPDAIALAAEHARRRITIDDGRSAQNPDPAIHPGNGDVFDLTNRFRGGDTITGITGVVDDTFGLFRIHPTTYGTYTATNLRPPGPDDVGGRLLVAAMNQLNYFTTLDLGPDICGPSQNLECRGADDANELSRQRAKLLAALSGMDADVIGLNEIENTTGVEVMADIVAGLNDTFGAGTYDYIDTGTIGTDAIKVGFIYRTTTVTPVGAHAILDSSVDPRFIDTKSRPALAQTFEENATGERFTVAVNHLKSKGSDCLDVGDPDTGDGQGNCNLTRTAAAEALVDWLASDPTGSGDPDILIMGDLNSYDKEDPIDAILEGPDDTLGTSDDYTDLVRQYLGEHAYSFVFDGQTGYLDHALANTWLVRQVTGTTEWHINADEPDILDYDTTFKQPAQDALYEPNAYRSSDHDPVIVGLELESFDFGGFLPPIDPDNQPNSRKAGSALPVMFSLGGDFGLDILVYGSPSWQACAGGPEVPAKIQSGLTYDPDSDQYSLVLKTDRAFKGTCQILTVRFVDGTVATVTFEFF
ncbi:MAG: ExeM/NucH family extracellular endonuclease [Acidimicrobiia bacterium]